MPSASARGPLSFADVVRVAREAAPSRSLRVVGRGATRSRAVIEALANDDAPHYGVSTGFGALATRHIPVELRTRLQRSLIRSHAAGRARGGAGGRRALMLLRISTLATGRTGVRPETLPPTWTCSTPRSRRWSTSTAASAAR